LCTTLLKLCAHLHTHLLIVCSCILCCERTSSNRDIILFRLVYERLCRSKLSLERVYKENGRVQMHKISSAPPKTMVYSLKYLAKYTYMTYMLVKVPGLSFSPGVRKLYVNMIPVSYTGKLILLHFIPAIYFFIYRFDVKLSQSHLIYSMFCICIRQMGFCPRATALLARLHAACMSLCFVLFRPTSRRFRLNPASQTMILYWPTYHFRPL